MGPGAAQGALEKTKFLAYVRNQTVIPCFKFVHFVHFFYISLLNFLHQPNSQCKICIHFKDVSLTCFGTSVPSSQST